MPVESIVISLVGNTTPRGVTPTTNIGIYDQIFKNCTWITVENPTTGQKSLYLERRVGFGTPTSDTDFSNISGFFDHAAFQTLGPVRYGTKAGGSLARIEIPYAATSQAYDHADGTAITHISEIKNSSGNAAIVWTRSSVTVADAWIYTNGGAVAQISTIPANSIGGFAHLNGWTFIANTNGRIYNSTLNNPETGYTDFIGADINPDTLVTILDFNNYIWAFGTQGVEAFKITENTTGSPLMSMPEMYHPVGMIPFTAGFYPYTKIESSLFWISAGNSSPRGIYRMDKDLKVERISTVYVDRALQESSLGVLKSGKFAGKSYLFVAINATQCWVYDIKENIWSIWESADVTWSKVSGWSSSTLYGCNSTNGVMAPITSSFTYTDNGNAVTREIITSKIDQGTNKYKTWISFAMLGDKASSTHNLTISWSDNDYASFTSGRTLDMSRANPRIDALGTSRRRAWKISDTNNSASRLEAIELYYVVSPQ